MSVILTGQESQDAHVETAASAACPETPKGPSERSKGTGPAETPPHPASPEAECYFRHPRPHFHETASHLTSVKLIQDRQVIQPGWKYSHAERRGAARDCASRFPLP